jgi:hypothetical protein
MTHRFGIVGNGRGEEIAPEVNTSGSDDLDVFIARDDIDIITVATPSGLHHEAVMKAAAAVAYTTQPIEMRMATRCRVTTTRIITAA